MYLTAGASTTVTIPLALRDFSIWSVETHDWEAVHGEFGVAVGGSSDDRRLIGAITH